MITTYDAHMASDEARLLRSVRRADALRRTLREPRALRALAAEVADEAPEGCVLLAWSEEGFALAVASALVAEERGKALTPERASHLQPLGSAPSTAAWCWLSIEVAIGLGPLRPWVSRWAEDRGGLPVTLRPVRPEFVAEVA